MGCLLLLAGLPNGRSQPAVAADLRPIAGVDRGELLMGELNCAACHPGATAAVHERLASKQPPLLTGAGSRLTPQFLLAFLGDPHGEKPGTTMPDVLGSLPPAEKAEVVDALVHYLSAQGQTESPAAVSAEPFKVEQGKRLYHTVGCVTCHQPFEAADDATALPAGLVESSIPLGNLAHKLTVANLARFLMDPLAVRPSGRMPRMGLSEAEANSIAIYLLRDQAPGLADPSKMDRLAGLKFHYFEMRGRARGSAGDAAVIAEFLDSYPGTPPGNARNNVRLVKSGVTEKPGIELRERDDAIGFLFDGYITAPTDGEYTFFTTSDDGSRLYIDGELVVNNDGDHGGDERFGKVTLKAGDHAFRVTWYENAGGEELSVAWQGPGFRKQQIPGGVLSHMGQAMKPTGAIAFTVDRTKAAQGRTYFQRYGCANCHGLPEDGPALAAAFRLKNLEELRTVSGGCLADQPAGDAVNYHLSAAQRGALRATLANRAALREPVGDKDRVTHTLARLNCYACHYRDASGGPVEERRAYFESTGDADLGDEGRLPPHLTGVGAKLNAGWLEEMLTKGTKVRPYMATRMPVFGDANVTPLVPLLARADGGDEPDRPVMASPEDAKFGRKLVGVKGLSCVACHGFGQYPSLGIPAMDLTMMTRRLRKEWFHRYLPNPFALRPGTRMPSFWPDGQAVNSEVFRGNTDKQIDAIWAFLSRGPQAAPPEGLVQGQWEIVADQEPVIYRHFIEGAGSRAIGVGYPEKANLAWDANEMRLALIWQGPFIDAAKHRAGRGVGYEGPLGYNVVRLAEGPPLAMLANAAAPWPTETGHAAGYRMRGYQFDEQRRPMFHFDFKGVAVTDYPVAVPGVIDANFKRTLTFSSENPPANLWFRAATGNQIVRTADGAWMVDGAIRIRFADAPGPVVARPVDGRTELLVQVVFVNGRAGLVEEIVW